MPRLGFETFHHILQHTAERLHGNFPLTAVEDLHKTRHVRAFEVLRQMNVHVERRDGMLYATLAIGDLHGMANRLYTDTIDGDVTSIR